MGYPPPNVPHREEDDELKDDINMEPHGFHPVVELHREHPALDPDDQQQGSEAKAGRCSPLHPDSRKLRSHDSAQRTWSNQITSLFSWANNISEEILFEKRAHFPGKMVCVSNKSTPDN